ncbi:GNAT family N-acetyltransferase [Ktedonosporobacter rubrisoli]|uniref:GNAT family N-acetyltransferase n=1 Tax=Ktedonosporobacter rubrisoli TaxID=2509675 RepID=A0A4P6K0V6_KTERU|nr:GNAT family N-acetyltransferase [Ktedonosporobacter rubrisoli]QBD81684.1 GNAT family N-acetyltransferase [Ktedonosporobacter rubrisoli]
MSQMELTIREALPQDSYAIATILHELGWSEYINHASAELTEVHIAESIIQSRREGTHTILVAEHPEYGVIGYTSVHWIHNLMLGHEGYLSELFLHPSATGQGIGGELLKQIRAYAAERGCTRLSLINRRIRESYRRGFYTKQGWQENPEAALFTLSLSSVS